MVNEGRDRVARARRGRGLARTALWLALAVIVWNAVFDRQVRSAEGQYVNLRVRHHAAVTIRDVMAPAIRRGAAAATEWAMAVVAAGAVTEILIRRGFRRQPSGEAVGATERG